MSQNGFNREFTFMSYMANFAKTTLLLTTFRCGTLFWSEWLNKISSNPDVLGQLTTWLNKNWKDARPQFMVIKRPSLFHIFHLMFYVHVAQKVYIIWPNLDIEQIYKTARDMGISILNSLRLLLYSSMFRYETLHPLYAYYPCFNHVLVFVCNIDRAREA